MPRQRIIGQRYHRCQKYLLTTSGVQLIREHYDTNRQSSIQFLCQQLQAPAWRVHLWARQAGIHGPHPYLWTEGEIVDLEQCYATMPLDRLAQKIGRSPVAIRTKAGHLGITKTSDAYTVQSLAQAIGCSHAQIRVWIARGWLTSRPRHTNRLRDMHYISAASVRRFRKEHQDEIDRFNIDTLWLRDIMAGSRGLGELA